MKNIFGKEEDLKLYDHENGVAIYEFIKKSNGYSYEITRDKHGSELTFKNSDGYSCEYTRDEHGNELTFKDSDGLTRGINK